MHIAACLFIPLFRPKFWRQEKVIHMDDLPLKHLCTEKCVGCNACVRACPVEDANIARMNDDGRLITLFPARFLSPLKNGQYHH